jgi:iron complex outermembrane receptor protein
VFAQDTLALSDSFKLTLGVKLEDNPYSGWETQPDVRLAWQVSDGTLLWAAASRAIRSATPFDQDVVERLGGVDFLIGNAHFRPEEVTAYEIGYRGDPTATFSVSISSFYNDYDDLRTIEPTPTTFIPLHWDNSMRGFTYGVTAWAKWQVTDWWRLSPGFTALHKRLKFAPGASGLLGVAQAGNDPSSHASLTSSMDLPHHLTFDASLRYVGALPDPALQEYYDLTARLGWRVSQALEISLTGFNLLDATHAEYPADNGEEIKRSVIAEARWRFQ